MSQPRRRPGLSAAEIGDRPGCSLGVCDGSGWVLGPENVARPCDCRPAMLKKRRARGVRSVIPNRYMNASLEIARNEGVNPRVVEHVESYLSDLDTRIAEGHGIWFEGSVGCGKTALAMVISKRALAAGRTVAIYSLPKLLATIRATYGDTGTDTYTGFFARLTSVDLLHIDDLGAEKRSDWVLEQLYAIVNDRYEEKRAMVVTTNLNEKDLADQIGARTTSRLFEICGAPVQVGEHADDLRTMRAPQY